MKHHAFYRKYKASGSKRHIFFKRNGWSIVLMVIGLVLIGPVIVYRHYYRSVPFSWDYYKRIAVYLLVLYIPFVVFLFWTNRRESIKRSRGYAWVGKFKVAAKRSSLLFCYLILIPGGDHKIKVNRSLFNKIHVGDFIVVRRDSLGKIEDVSRVNFSTRISMSKRFNGGID